MSLFLGTMGVPAPGTHFTVALLESLAKTCFIEFRGEPELALPVGIRAFGSHLTLSETELLADLCFLEVGHVLELGLAMSKAAFFSFCAMTLKYKSRFSLRRVGKGRFWS